MKGNGETAGRNLTMHWADEWFITQWMAHLCKKKKPGQCSNPGISIIFIKGEENITAIWNFICWSSKNTTGVTRHSNKNRNPGPVSSLHFCRWPFYLGLCGLMMSQLSNASESFSIDFSCKLALLMIWHLKLCTQFGGNFSLKESNLENSVKKIRHGN